MEDRIVDEVFQTRRLVSPGAEEWLYKPIKCLDHGFVYLVDYMGSDDAVVQAARVSYGKGTKKVSEDKGLIRYLRRHMHTTPFEMVEFKFHCKMPIFVARQWIRHRTANVNEYSGRYSEMMDEFYMPDESVLWKQSQTNRQGGGKDLLEPEKAAAVLKTLKADYESVYSHYKEFLDSDLRRELARINLSVANYTQWYWKIDLHNLMHFLGLRLDAHAQYEIRVFGEAMAQIVKDAVPICYEAFEDYQVNGMRLSGLEVDLISDLISNRRLFFTKEQIMTIASEKFHNKRETEEFVDKFERLRCLHFEAKN